LRQEDKEVDGPGLEHAEERKRENELVEEREDELFDLDGLPETTLDGERSAEVLIAMKQVLAGDRLVINDLKLPKRQLIALEAMKTAVEGKDQRLSQFVYAEDRRTLLEQALAVLQPEIASMQGAGTQFEDMLAQVGTLRDRLNVLEDAEEGFLEMRPHDQTQDGNETDDKPDETDDKNDSDLDDPKKKQAKPKPPAAPKTDGKTADEEEDRSLTGPERPEPPKGPTTLGDPQEIAQAAESLVPRWRRSDG
jgi:hypothetical protein